MSLTIQAEWCVAGDRDRGAFFSFGEDLEEQLGGVLVQTDVEQAALRANGGTRSSAEPCSASDQSAMLARHRVPHPDYSHNFGFGCRPNWTWCNRVELPAISGIR